MTYLYAECNQFSYDNSMKEQDNYELQQSS
jgi:hypothetical protein